MIPSLIEFIRDVNLSLVTIKFKNEKPFKMPTLLQKMSILSITAGMQGIIIAALGCPNGCDFCVTSHYWKRRYIPYFKSGYEIYTQIKKYKRDHGLNAVIIIDEEFLLNRKRALEYLECIRKERHWDVHLMCFSSIKALSQYSLEELMEMNLEIVWLGYEAHGAGYAKMEGKNPDELIRELQSHGIAVLASSIIGYDYQTREVIEKEFQTLMTVEPSFTQFLIYSPVYGTPLYDRLKKENRLLPGFDDPRRYRHKEIDGFTLQHRHPHLSQQEASEIVEELYKKDYELLGPSIIRIARVWFEGYLRMIEN
ncbi:MAG: radical SAM protein [Acidobacteriota bacterium]